MLQDSTFVLGSILINLDNKNQFQAIASVNAIWQVNLLYIYGMNFLFCCKYVY